MAAILSVSWKKTGSHGYGRLIIEFTIPPQSSIISAARAAYRREYLKSAWQITVPYAVSRKISTTKPMIVLAGTKSLIITTPTANRK